jgi:predicted dehydrogenase
MLLVSCPTLRGMDSLGIGIIGTGNIAGAYATDSLTHPQLRLVAATDLDRERARAFADEHGCRVHETVDDLLADPEIDIVVNLTVHHAHYEVSRRALEAGKHVYSEKPLALEPSEARHLLELAAGKGVRLGCSPATFLGEAQQTAAAALRSGRFGEIRAVYAEVNHGRIEVWHPAPVAFYDVGVMVDVGVYPLTLVTAMLGPARRVRAWSWELLPERRTLAGEPYRIGSPDLIVAGVELESGAVLRLTTSFYVGRPARQTSSIEFHGDLGSLSLGSFQAFDAAVEAGPFRGELEPVPFVREPYPGTAWSRGVAEMAEAILEDRPHRATGEQAAHIVDILAAVAESRAHDGRSVAVSSTFPRPELMDWARLRADVS